MLFMEKEIAILYMVAGLSSRFEGKIKQFAKVGPDEETLIEYSLKQALPAGFTKIIFVVGEKTQAPFKEMFGDNYKGIPVYYALQSFDPEKRDKPWGTLDALCSAKHLLDCPFVICNGDDIYGENTFKTLVNHLKTKSTAATIGYKLKEALPETGSVNRGLFEINPDNTVKRLVETFNIEKSKLKERGLSEDHLVSMLIFAFHPETLTLLNKNLLEFKEKNTESRTSECLVPDETSRLVEEGKLTMDMYPAKDKWFGITNPGDEDKVREELKKITN